MDTIDMHKNPNQTISINLRYRSNPFVGPRNIIQGHAGVTYTRFVNIQWEYSIYDGKTTKSSE